MAKETISQTEGLCKEVTNCIRDAYDRGYKRGFNEGQAHQLASDDVFRESCEKSAYEKGLNDAWECCRKIVRDMVEPHFESAYMVDIFRCESAITAMTSNSPSEAIARIKEYEEKQKQDDDEIKVGDEVIFPNGKKGIVWLIYGNECHTMGDYNRVRPKEYLKKTGRHFDQIAEVLEQLKGE